jgi:hypothetical protein
MTEPEPSRRSPVLAVVLAMVFLAVIGASVGFILGNQTSKAGQNVATGPSSTASPTPQASTTTPVDSVRSTDPTTTKTTAPPKTYKPPAKDVCPDITVEAASQHGGKAPFKVRLYVKTSKSEVWICMDANTNLFYQGHILGRPFNGATTSSTLFLTTIEPRDHDYKATNNSGGKTTYYYVSPTALVIENSDGGQETQTVVDYFQQ